jgi:hypothetical protein
MRLFSPTGDHYRFLMPQNPAGGPEQTVLYRLIEEHYPRFVEEVERSGACLPKFIHQEFEDCLKCGLLEHRFVRVNCDGCRIIGVRVKTLTTRAEDLT